MQVVSFAKINLFLEVIAKLPGNFHEIFTVYCSVNLFDTLRFALTKRGLINLWTNVEELNTDSNLVYKVALFLNARYKPSNGIDISLEKNIPISAGLGGGSSNAAVTIKALNALWELGISDDELTEMAAEFGSDVPYFLRGGTALGRGKGDLITPISDIKIGNLLLVNPGIPIASREAYQLVRIPVNPRKWDTGDIDGCVFNRLQEEISRRYPTVESIIDILNEHGANRAVMSGSGSTCFGIFTDKTMMMTCQKQFLSMGYWTKVLRTIGRVEYLRCFQNLN